MGTQNQKSIVNQLPKFMEGKCPICNNSIEIDHTYKLETDAIQYYCATCSPNGCMIALSGTLLACEPFNRILNDQPTKDYVTSLIRKCTSGEVMIGMKDFRD